MADKKKSHKKKRKHTTRPLRYRGRLKHPDNAANTKRLWADPVWRAMMMEKRRIAGEKRRGVAQRLGVPDGMHRAAAEPLNQLAREKAKETMSDLEASGLLLNTEDAAKEALQTALVVMRSPGEKAVKLAAARLVLDFTKAKPASRSELTINKAEEWLAAVAADSGSKQGDTPSDA